MMLNPARLLVLFAAALLLGQAHAQGYPSKPVKIVVAAGPGVAVDVTIRAIAEQLRARLAQPFVVENRPGAGGALALEQVAAAPADGYVLLASFDAPLTMSPSVFPNFPVDPVRQFVPAAIFGDGGASVLVVSPGLPVRTLQELVAHAKQNPGKLDYASGGHSTLSNILGELFKRRAGVDIQHVPHTGAVAAISEVVAQRVAMYISTPGPVLGHIRAGALRPLALAGARRSPLLPDVPTFVEAGYPEINPPEWWHALLAPAGTPNPVVERLNAEVLRIAQTPAVREHLEQQGLEPGTLKPEPSRERIRHEVNYWKGVVKTLGIKAG
jgi:tripartite-type tricarboxylate transporter receptor subunit TctC